MKGTYHGSCYCGAVRFAADIDIPSSPRAPWRPDDPYPWTYKCNCTFCTKTRYWKLFVPDRALRIEQGEDALADYQFGSMMVHHRFCRRCGVAPFGTGELEVMGGRFHAINVGCLDDVTPEELLSLPVRFEDGRHDDWEHPPAETRHL